MAFVEVFANTVEQLFGRTLLALDVLAGRVPHEVPRRHWNRSAEAPILISVRNFEDDRLIMSVLVHPPLESPQERAMADHLERVSDVKDVIARGCNQRVMNTVFETNYSLRWSVSRRVWTTEDGIPFSYDEEARGVAR